MFDYGKLYYKVMNEKERHYNFQYKNGLNILQKEFDDNPTHRCCSGGLYFTEYKYLPLFLEAIDNATYIREVIVPKDARVVMDPEGDKYRADKIILGERYHLWDDFDKWFDPERWNWKCGSYVLAEYFPDHFDKWWDPEKFDWRDGSSALARYCSSHFKKWWDIEKFDRKSANFLKMYCQPTV